MFRILHIPSLLYVGKFGSINNYQSREYASEYLSGCKSCIFGNQYILVLIREPTFVGDEVLKQEEFMIVEVDNV